MTGWPQEVDISGMAGWPGDVDVSGMPGWPQEIDISGMAGWPQCIDISCMPAWPQDVVGYTADSCHTENPEGFTPSVPGSTGGSSMIE